MRENDYKPWRTSEQGGTMQVNLLGKCGSYYSYCPTYVLDRDWLRWKKESSTNR